MDVAADVIEAELVGGEGTDRRGARVAVCVIGDDTIRTDAGKLRCGIVRVVCERIGRRPLRPPCIELRLVGIALARAVAGFEIQARHAAPFLVGGQPVAVGLRDALLDALALREPFAESLRLFAGNVDDGMIRALGEIRLPRLPALATLHENLVVLHPGFPPRHQEIGSKRFEPHAHSVLPCFPEDNTVVLLEGGREGQVLPGGNLGPQRKLLVTLENDEEFNGAGLHLRDEQGAIRGSDGDAVHVDLRPGRLGGELDGAVAVFAHHRPERAQPLAAGIGAHLRIVERAVDEGGDVVVGGEEPAADAAGADPVAEGDGLRLCGQDDFLRLPVLGDGDVFGGVGRALGGFQEIAPDALPDVAGADMPVAFGKVGHAEMIFPDFPRHGRGEILEDTVNQHGIGYRFLLDGGRDRLGPVAVFPDNEADLAADFGADGGGRGDAHERPFPVEDLRTFGRRDHAQQALGHSGLRRRDLVPGQQQAVLECDPGGPGGEAHEHGGRGPDGKAPVAAALAALEVVKRCGQPHGRGDLALGDARLADIADDLVQLQPALALQACRQLIGKLGEIKPILSRRDLIEDFPQRIDIRLRGAGTLGRHEALGADEGALVAGGDEADVGELGLAVDKNHVGRLDVAVREVPLVEVPEGFRKAHSDIDAQGGVQADGDAAIPAQGAGLVFDRVDLLAGAHIITELHHVVIEGDAVRAAADVEDVHQARMVPGNGLELQDALELPLEGALVVEILAVDDLDGTQRAGDAPRHPHLAVCPAADLAEDIMVRDARMGADRGGHRVANFKL